MTADGRRVPVPSPPPLVHLVALCCMLLGATSAAADDEALRRHPGFIDFEALSLADAADLEVHVSIKGAILTMVAEATRESEPELADALAALEGIEVRVYEIDDEHRGPFQGDLDATAASLFGKGWEPAITVRLQQERGYVMMRTLDGVPHGLAALYLDGSEVVFVNIVGRIDPRQIGRLASRFDLDLQDAVAAPRVDDDETDAATGDDDS